LVKNLRKTIIAAKNEDSDALVRETSDLLYHLIVLLRGERVNFDQLSAELS